MPSIRPTPSADASEGDFVLDNYGRYRTANRGLRLVSWDATCRRGRQKLAVSVRTGEKTPALLVLNRFMNGITELRVDGVTGDALRMDPGAPTGPFQMIGVNPSRFDSANARSTWRRRLSTPPGT